MVIDHKEEFYKEKKEVEQTEMEIIPKKDFHIFQPPKTDIYLKEGESVTVPVRFLPNLRTEKVID